MPCNKIDKPLAVYRFSGKVMTRNYYVFTSEMRLQSNVNVI